MLAAIGHAIMTAHYPDFAHEHSWDGMSYSVQDTQGTRGTVTFDPDCCVAAFRDDRIQRAGCADALGFFAGAPSRVIHLAETETLQYLLDEIDGHPVPSITAAFWIEHDQLCAVERFDEVMRNGASILRREMLDEASAVDAWVEHWEMTDAQRDLMISLYQRKIAGHGKRIVLSAQEIAAIGTTDEAGIAESRVSFREIGIEWPEPITLEPGAD